MLPWNHHNSSVEQVEAAGKCEFRENARCAPLSFKANGCSNRPKGGLGAALALFAGETCSMAGMPVSKAFGHLSFSVDDINLMGPSGQKYF